jgi:NADH dehydrogenase [ubiquinone] 1 alpha subcomplex assembly factor 5
VPRPPGIFETQRKRSGNIAISDNRPNTVVNRRSRQTAAATQVIILERNSARDATRPSQKIERLPAGSAKDMVVLDNLAATWATRRQRISDQFSGKSPQRHHGALVARIAAVHKPGMNNDLFDRAARRRAFARSARASDDSHWLLHRMADELCDRLSVVQRNFDRALIIGHCQQRIKSALEALEIDCWHCMSHQDGQYLAKTIITDEDRLSVADCSFDLIIACGTLDSVNDVPGALILIRKLLRPNGLFLGSMLGGGSLPILKQCFFGAQIEGRPTAQRFHPQIDVRAAGDLLTRAGFAMPVADHEMVTARYAHMSTLVGDIRAMGLSNVLIGRTALGRTLATNASAGFAAYADGDGKTAETFAINYLTGWAPAVGETLPSGPVRQFFPVAR